MHQGEDKARTTKLQAERCVHMAGRGYDVMGVVHGDEIPGLPVLMRWRGRSDRRFRLCTEWDTIRVAQDRSDAVE